MRLLCSAIVDRGAFSPDFPPGLVVVAVILFRGLPLKSLLGSGDCIGAVYLGRKLLLLPDFFATLRAEVIIMEFRKEPGRIFATDETGKLLAEVTFPEKEGVAVINHTFVDASLRGQGVAGQLLRAVADTLRQEGRRARPICSYAVHWFETHPEERDLLGE